MNGANGVTRVRSVSGTGLSIIYVEFDWDTNIYLDRQIVTERLGPVQLDLPTGVQPLIAPMSSIMGEIMLVAMSSSTVDPMDLREIANWVIAPRLRAVPGVSRIVPIGGLVKEYRVTIDNLRMSQLKVSFNTIRTALEAYGQIPAVASSTREPRNSSSGIWRAVRASRTSGTWRSRSATGSPFFCARSPTYRSSRGSGEATRVSWVLRPSSCPSRSNSGRHCLAHRGGRFGAR